MESRVDGCFCKIRVGIAALTFLVHFGIFLNSVRSPYGPWFELLWVSLLYLITLASLLCNRYLSYNFSRWAPFVFALMALLLSLITRVMEDATPSRIFNLVLSHFIFFGPHWVCSSKLNSESDIENKVQDD